jgi:hypothetical protein
LSIGPASRPGGGRHKAKTKAAEVRRQILALKARFDARFRKAAELRWLRRCGLDKL